MELVILFTSYYFANKLDKILVDTDIDFKLAPVPPEISDSCGVAIRIKPQDLSTVQTIMKEHHISPSRIYTYKKGETPSVYIENSNSSFS